LYSQKFYKSIFRHRGNLIGTVAWSVQPNLVSLVPYQSSSWNVDDGSMDQIRFRRHEIAFNTLLLKFAALFFTGSQIFIKYRMD